MSKRRYTEEQIIGILKESETGAQNQDLCRKYGMSEASLCKWKAKFGGMGVSDARRLKALETENGRLKRIVANLTLDIQVLKDINSKNW